MNIRGCYDFKPSASAAFRPGVLRHLAAHPDGDRRNDIHAAMPELLRLTEAQASERLANCRFPVAGAGCHPSPDAKLAPAPILRRDKERYQLDVRRADC